MIKNIFSKGFTLIEIVMVISIVSVIASISMPNFNDWKNRDAVGHATRVLSINLKEGRIDAATKNRSIHVLLSNRSIIYDAPDPVTGFCGRCENRSESLDSYSKNITVSPNIDIIFFSDGTATPVNITVSATGISKTLTINILGRVFY